MLFVDFSMVINNRVLPSEGVVVVVGAAAGGSVKIIENPTPLRLKSSPWMTKFSRDLPHLKKSQ